MDLLLWKCRSSGAVEANRSISDTLGLVRPKAGGLRRTEVKGPAFFIGTLVLRKCDIRCPAHSGRQAMSLGKENGNE